MFVQLIIRLTLISADRSPVQDMPKSSFVIPEIVILFYTTTGNISFDWALLSQRLWKLLLFLFQMSLEAPQSEADSSADDCCCRCSPVS